MTKRIAFFGGSFNPVHYGHVELARNVVEKGYADEVWFSPSPRNPFKEEKNLMPLLKRVALLHNAIDDIHGLKITDVEQSLPVPSYTVAALDALTGRWPECEFVLLIGSDNLERFTAWKSWSELLERYGLLVYPRRSGELVSTNVAVELPEELKQWSHKIIVMDDMPLYDISSTQIREGCRSCQG